jgi:DNA-binding transcriptional regulator YdaS (Cro superfamily)
MTWEQYFKNKPRGSKAMFAKNLGITRTWLSLVMSGRVQCSPELACKIERLTLREIKRRDLRPDLFGGVK